MWKLAYASVTGTSHTHASIPCQDYCNFKEIKDGADDILIVGIADGAGSASNAFIGASIAVENILSNIASSNIKLSEFTKAHAEELLRKTCQYLIDIANENNINIKELSCTLLVACLSPDLSLFFQIGDGAWVIKTDDGFRSATWPFTGQYANETKFITSPEAFEYLQFSVITKPVLGVAGFTDGLQLLILDYSQKIPHAGFFEPVFEDLSRTSDDLNISEHLKKFLDSEIVNQRTDDDKTLFFVWRV